MNPCVQRMSIADVFVVRTIRTIRDDMRHHTGPARALPRTVGLPVSCPTVHVALCLRVPVCAARVLTEMPLYDPPRHEAQRLGWDALTTGNHLQTQHAPSLTRCPIQQLQRTLCTTTPTLTPRRMRLLTAVSRVAPTQYAIHSSGNTHAHDATQSG